MKLAIAMLMMAGFAQIQIGQQVVHPKAPACPKYQHWVFDECHGEAGMWACPTDPSSGKCVDDMHVLTEKEWQHLGDAMKVDEDVIRILLEHVKQLEDRICTDEKGILRGCPKKAKP